MMEEEEADSHEDSPVTQIIEYVLGNLEQEGLKPIITPLEVGKEEEDELISDATTIEVPRDRGREESEQEVVEGDHEEGEEIEEAQPSRPPTIARPPSLVLKVGHFSPSPVAPISSSSRHYAHFHPQKLAISQSLVKVPTPSPSNADNHHL